MPDDDQLRRLAEALWRDPEGRRRMLEILTEMETRQKLAEWSDPDGLERMWQL